MKRIIAVVFLLCAFLPTIAYAHGGRTDENGGHVDSSTGEYHYHHGYEAHDHYDMDGDGDVDCPYDFDDKTGENSGSPSSSSTTGVLEKYFNGYVAPIPSPTPRPTVKPEPTKTEMGIGEKIFLYTIGGAFALACLCALANAVFWAVFEIKEKMQSHRDKEEKRRKQKELFEEERKTYIALYGGKRLEDLVPFPVGSYLVEDLLPTSGGEHWGVYTFFVTKDKYHRPSCRFSQKGKPQNAYYIQVGVFRQKPCSICKPVLPDMTWVGECQKINAIKKKYGIP